MASTNKTETLGLPQWILSDKPQMADFNGAFSAIEKAIAELHSELEQRDRELEQRDHIIEAIQERLNHTTTFWKLNVKAGTSRPVMLTQPDGNPLSADYVYRISARVSNTSVNTWSTAIVAQDQRTDIDSLVLVKEDYLSDTSNHPKFLIKDGTVYISLWNHENYFVDVYIERFPNLEEAL